MQFLSLPIILLTVLVWCGIEFVGCSQLQAGSSTCVQVSNKGTDSRDDRSHSFLKPRSITTNNVFQDNLNLYWWYHDVLCEENCIWWTMQISPFVQRSTNSKDTAEFFFPCNKSEISIKENGTGDVGSLWLNLIAADDQSFDASASMRPVRTVAGAFFEFRLDFSAIICHSWADVAFAVIHAKHDLHFCETLSNYPGVACDVATVGQALDQEGWLFGKFQQCSLTRRGIDDIQLKFGYDWFYCDTNHFSPYIVGTIATGKNDHSVEYIFDPIIGSNHGSIGVGAIGDYRILDSDIIELTLLTDIKYRYVLRATDRRSFDLCKNGDWSRYLQVVQQCAPSNSLPGINLLTQEVRVTPGSTVDVWLALHYQQCQWNVECGYDFWWRAKELIKLCSFPENFGIYDLAGDCTSNPVSASNARICQSIVNNIPKSDASFVALTASDLDLNSGASPKALSNTLYLAAAYNGYLRNSPAFIGFGGSYEWGHKSLSNWAVWLRCALAF